MSTTTEALEALEQIARATCEDAIDHGIVSQFVSTIRAALEDVPDLSEREANRERPLPVELEDAASLCFNVGMERAAGALREIERLQAKLERVEGLAGEVAGDLEAELNDRYHGPDDVHPAMQRKYERDMEPIHELREALSGGEEGT